MPGGRTVTSTARRATAVLCSAVTGLCVLLAVGSHWYALSIALPNGRGPIVIRDYALVVVLDDPVQRPNRQLLRVWTRDAPNMPVPWRPTTYKPAFGSGPEWFYIPLWIVAAITACIGLHVWPLPRSGWGGSGRCDCGYDLAGNLSGRCPECGRGCPPATMRQRRATPRWKARAFRLARLASIVALLGACVAVGSYVLTTYRKVTVYELNMKDASGRVHDRILLLDVTVFKTPPRTFPSALTPFLREHGDGTPGEWRVAAEFTRARDGRLVSRSESHRAARLVDPTAPRFECDIATLKRFFPQLAEMIQQDILRAPNDGGRRLELIRSLCHDPSDANAAAVIAEWD
jgi:hypothetical protein